MAIGVGAQAPPLDGATGPRAIVFYKTTCGTARLAGPPLARLAAYGPNVVAVGQDPQPELDAFGDAYGWSFPQIADLAPYDLSNAYAVTVSPTLFVVDAEGRVADVVESWDRHGMNRASATLAGLLGAEPAVLSDPSDGLPDRKPG